RALRAALAGREDEIAARASTALARIRGVKLHRAADGREAAREASAWVERGGEDAALRAELLHAEGAIDKSDGKYADAEGRDRRALELRERLLPPRPLLVAESLDALASDLRLQGSYDAALAASRRALEL